jgi:hypothetical protein
MAAAKSGTQFSSSGIVGVSACCFISDVF